MNKVYDTEIISVGTELLLGHVTNTDSRDISEMLSKICERSAAANPEGKP